MYSPKCAVWNGPAELSALPPLKLRIQFPDFDSISSFSLGNVFEFILSDFVWSTLCLLGALKRSIWRPFGKGMEMYIQLPYIIRLSEENPSKIYLSFRSKIAHISEENGRFLRDTLWRRGGLDGAAVGAGEAAGGGHARLPKRDALPPACDGGDAHEGHCGHAGDTPGRADAPDYDVFHAAGARLLGTDGHAEGPGGPRSARRLCVASVCVVESVAVWWWWWWYVCVGGWWWGGEARDCLAHVGRVPTSPMARVLRGNREGVPLCCLSPAYG